MIKAALIGYGRMGQAIDALAEEQGVEIISRIDPKEAKAEWRSLSSEAVDGADVCIDFTQPNKVVSNIEFLTNLGKPVVIGTTGWSGEMERVKSLVANREIALFYSDNFSIGMNLFKMIVGEAAAIIDSWPHYDVALTEWHHRHKLDSPSGTARAIAEILLDKVERKKRVVTESLQRKPEEEELHLQSIRCGAIPGRHQVIIDSPADSITIEHSARNRDGFAIGALVAAKWLVGKRGIFSMKDLLEGESDEKA